MLFYVIKLIFSLFNINAQIIDGYTNSEVNIFWKNHKQSVIGVEDIHLPQFRIVDYKTSTYIEELATGIIFRMNTR